MNKTSWLVVILFSFISFFFGIVVSYTDVEPYKNKIDLCQRFGREIDALIYEVDAQRAELAILMADFIGGDISIYKANAISENLLQRKQQSEFQYTNIVTKYANGCFDAQDN